MKRTLTVEYYDNKEQFEIQNNSNNNNNNKKNTHPQLNDWTRKTRKVGPWVFNLARTLLFRKRRKYIYASVYMCASSYVGEASFQGRSSEHHYFTN